MHSNSCQDTGTQKSWWTDLYFKYHLPPQANYWQKGLALELGNNNSIIKKACNTKTTEENIFLSLLYVI